MRELKYPAIYKHFKGGIYKVLNIAEHTETKEKIVVYASVPYEGMTGKIYARPYDMFMSEVNREKYPEVKQKYRFEEVK